MSVTRADITALLQENYGSEPYEQLNHEVRVLSMFDESETAQWDGDIAVESLHVGRNYSSMAINEANPLPVSGRQGWAELRVPMRYLYGSINLTAQAIKTAADRNTFANVLESEVNGMVQDMLVEVNRIMWGSGVGTLALVQGDIGGAPVTTIPLDTPGGYAGTVNGARFIRPGMLLGFHDAAPGNNTPNAVVAVSSVAADGTDMVIASGLDNTDAPDNGIITKATNRVSTDLKSSFNAEPMGIGGIIDDATIVSTIFGLDRTTVNGEKYRANVLSSIGDLDEFVFWRLLDMCDEMSGHEPDKFMCHHSVHREYIETTSNDRRYTGEQNMNPDAGIEGGGRKHELTFSTTPIMKERMAPYGTLYGIDSAACKRYETVPGEWIDEDGSILHRDNNYDRFDAAYRIWRNHGAKRVNSSFVARGINATVDIVNAS